LREKQPPRASPAGSRVCLKRQPPWILRVLIDAGRARELVEERIAGFGKHPHDRWTPVITRVEGFERGWIVYYGAAEPDAMLAGNAPFIVDSQTGEVHATGTARPIEEYIANYLRTGDPHQ